MRDPVPTPADAFSEFIRRIGLVLREHEFKGSGQNYRRDCGAQWQAINVQKSQWRVDRDDSICFYVNVGLQFPKLKFKRHVEPPATITKFIATKADQTFRIDELFPAKRFGRSAVDGSKLREVSARFEKLFRKQLVPLLHTMATPEGLARLLRTMPWLTTPGARKFVGADLAPPRWDPRDRDAGLWKQDKRGLWWGPGEW